MSNTLNCASKTNPQNQHPTQNNNDLAVAALSILNDGSVHTWYDIAYDNYIKSCVREIDGLSLCPTGDIEESNFFFVDDECNNYCMTSKDKSGSKYHTYASLIISCMVCIICCISYIQCKTTHKKGKKYTINEEKNILVPLSINTNIFDTIPPSPSISPSTCSQLHEHFVTSPSSISSAASPSGSSTYSTSSSNWDTEEITDEFTFSKTDEIAEVKTLYNWHQKRKWNVYRDDLNSKTIEATDGEYDTESFNNTNWNNDGDKIGKILLKYLESVGATGIEEEHFYKLFTSPTPQAIIFQLRFGVLNDICSITIDRFGRRSYHAKN
eukprot:107093_1